MNCNELRRLLSAEERQEKRTAMEAHASECTECAQVLKGEQPVDRLLAGLREASMELDVPPAIERQVLAEFRDRNRMRRSSPSLRAWPWMAAAAAALVVTGLVLWNARRPASDGPAIIASAQESGAAPKARPMGESRPALQAATAPSRSGSVQEPPPVGSLRTPTRGQHRAIPVPAKNRLRAAEGTEFFPTMRVLADEPGTDLQLVRVRVSRRMLEGFGLSLDPRFPERPVKADLLVGPDGLTRAVRFISEQGP